MQREIVSSQPLDERPKEIKHYKIIKNQDTTKFNSTCASNLTKSNQDITSNAKNAVVTPSLQTSSSQSNSLCKIDSKTASVSAISSDKGKLIVPFKSSESIADAKPKEIKHYSIIKNSTTMQVNSPQPGLANQQNKETVSTSGIEQNRGMVYKSMDNFNNVPSTDTAREMNHSNFENVKVVKKESQQLKGNSLISVNPIVGQKGTNTVVSSQVVDEKPKEIKHYSIIKSSNNDKTAHVTNTENQNINCLNKVSSKETLRENKDYEKCKEIKHYSIIKNDNTSTPLSTTGNLNQALNNKIVRSTNSNATIQTSNSITRDSSMRDSGNTLNTSLSSLSQKGNANSLNSTVEIISSTPIDERPKEIKHYKIIRK
ncbi:hypothetical protein HDU92_005335 [Lobulomyces angularis]|nr:hypothetical protein HDU92_005335 [Lobulomyces angularis]